MLCKFSATEREKGQSRGQTRLSLVPQKKKKKKQNLQIKKNSSTAEQN